MYFSTSCSLCWFAADFFARGLHTRTAVARLPYRQLGFLWFLILTAILWRSDSLFFWNGDMQFRNFSRLHRTGWIKTRPVKKLVVRVKFTGNSYSYRTCVNVNGHHWNICKLVFTGTRIRLPVLVLVSVWMHKFHIGTSTGPGLRVAVYRF